MNYTDVTSENTQPTSSNNYGSGALWGALGNIGSSVLGYFGQKQTNKTNKQIAADARQHEVDMWNMQNAYNNPSAQMKRLLDAGLNPNLVYGSGNVSGLQTGEKPKTHSPEYKSPISQLEIPNMLNYLREFSDYQVKRTQIDNIGEATNLSRQRRYNLGLTAPVIQGKARLQDQQHQFKKELHPYSLEIQKATAGRQEHLTNVARHRAKLLGYDAQIADQMSKYNLRYTDAAYLRIAEMIFGKMKNLKTPFSKSPTYWREATGRL